MEMVCAPVALVSPAWSANIFEVADLDSFACSACVVVTRTAVAVDVPMSSRFPNADALTVAGTTRSLVRFVAPLVVVVVVVLVGGDVAEGISTLLSLAAVLPPVCGPEISVASVNRGIVNRRSGVVKDGVVSLAISVVVVSTWSGAVVAGAVAPDSAGTGVVSMSLGRPAEVEEDWGGLDQGVEVKVPLPLDARGEGVVYPSLGSSA
jgi:hypothetical protein